MITFFEKWKKEMKKLIKNRYYIFMLSISFFLLLFSIFISKIISFQNDIIFQTTPVNDTLFYVIPRIDLSWIFVGLEITLIIIAFLYGIFIEPQKLPFAFLAFSLFIFIRSICISLTHIGVPADFIYPTMGNGEFFFQNDLFFSGHTGGPFLIALILWEKNSWRYFLLCISVIMAFTVLAMRLHYSIDIVGAYFITYGIFKITEFIYNKDRGYNQYLRKYFSQ